MKELQIKCKTEVVSYLWSFCHTHLHVSQAMVHIPLACPAATSGLLSHRPGSMYTWHVDQYKVPWGDPQHIPLQRGMNDHVLTTCHSSFLPVELPCVPAVAQTSGAGGQHHPEFDGACGAAADFWWCYSSFTSELFSSLHVAACFAPRWVLFGQQCHVRPGDVFRASSHALQTVWAAFPGLPRSCRWTMCPLSCFWPAWLWWWQDAFHLL